MKGNHVVWGRVHAPVPDVTTAEDRRRIAECQLVEVAASRWRREVWKDGVLLGSVRVGASGQDYRPVGCREWLFAAYTWGDGDPHWGPAILALLDWAPDDHKESGCERDEG